MTEENYFKVKNVQKAVKFDKEVIRAISYVRSMIGTYAWDNIVKESFTTSVKDHIDRREKLLKELSR